ncbi:gamma-crystallin M3-like isoform X2 [Boleophthalmus pectinirostris]|uniref:gamma-crystallin M3-like isoform X2 n=1 Tax=Boleophthalmus pectinirostris TaxID=150288 RepID=UPI000A1C2CA7|nr:gamma-crystallin M3-like isoform X2 [Boleophthalmus pectinirostris]
MGRIIFYEERHFQGRSFESSGDSSDLLSHLSRCSSVRVDSGCFVVYDRPNFTGTQVFLRRGEYPDVQRIWSQSGMGGATQMDTIRSCRIVPMHRGQFRMRVYERENLLGQMHELMDDCESLQERFYMSDCQSCHVMEGHWLLFEQTNYRGRQLYVRPGEYRNLRDIGGGNMTRISSIRRITDNC